MKKVVWFALLAFTSSLYAVDGDIQRSFKTGKGGRLTLSSDLGSIEVATGAGDNVEVKILFEKNRGSERSFRDAMDKIDVDLKQSGKNVSVTLDVKDKTFSLWNSIGKYVRVRFKITVPDEYNVDLGTSGGSIEVDDLKGEVFAHTSGGSLRFGHIYGKVNGKTSGGSISLEGCEGDAVIKTSGGGISIGKVKGNVRAGTSGGTINIEEVRGDIDAKTSGGSIRARLSKQPESACSLETSGGSITVYLEKDIGVNLDASTSGGGVHCEFPVTVKGTISRNSLRAKINGGGPVLYLRTSGGSINVREL